MTKSRLWGSRGYTNSGPSEEQKDFSGKAAGMGGKVVNTAGATVRAQTPLALRSA